MGSVETLVAFERSVEQFRAMYRVDPELLVTDLHPGYLTRRWADERTAEALHVQHHHAHAAALMAEHGVERDAAVVACAFDGTGYGTDGTVWGGEVLVARYEAFERAAHLRTIPIPGGDAGVRSPARIALAHLRAAGVPWTADLPPVLALSSDARVVLDRQLARRVACVHTSSIGRLFDAVSALLGIRQLSSYEGQAAMELEAAADVADDDGPSLACSIDDGVIDPAPLLRELVAAQRLGAAVGSLARAFHLALADAIVAVTTRVSEATGITTVGLTGGVFQNALLTTVTRRRLEERDLRVLVHRRVPPNDGGLALGQAAVAAARSLA
jgi:hydrogenase maturation protein HypF